MNDRVKKRIAWALKCKPEDVPEEPQNLAKALDKRIADLKKAKLEKVKDG